MELLKQLYKIYSPSNGEKKMRKFVAKVARSYGAETITDKHGNLLITKGVSDTYPCIAAHLDQVQKNHSKDFDVFFKDDVLFGFSVKNNRQEGLGADDKNGIWIALKCLEKYDVLKCAFFVGEEIGCIGSEGYNGDFFSDVRWIIEPDRRGSSDLITSIWSPICSDEFIADIMQFASTLGYKETEGMTTDVATLIDKPDVKVSCLNLSCGYHEPHTDKEYTVFSQLMTCLSIVCYAIENMTKVYEFEAPAYNPQYDWYGYGSRRYYDEYEQIYEFLEALGYESVEQYSLDELTNYYRPCCGRRVSYHTMQDVVNEYLDFYANYLEDEQDDDTTKPDGTAIVRYHGDL